MGREVLGEVGPTLQPPFTTPPAPVIHGPCTTPMTFAVLVHSGDHYLPGGVCFASYLPEFTHTPPA